MNKRWRKVPIHITLWVVFIIMLFPVWIMLTTSLQAYENIFNWPPEFLPTAPEWINYITVWFGKYEFYQPFFNSVIISTSTALISLILAFPAAYALTRFTFVGRNSMIFIVLVTQMFSPVVLIVGLYQLIQVYSLLNTLTGVIITNCAFTTPMSVWLLHGYMQNIPQTLEQAAFMDGCSRIRAIFRVVLPLSAPGIALASIYSFIMSWNDLLIPLIFISESRLRPVSLALTDFAGQNVVYWHEMMAASILTTIPIAVMFSFVQKYFVQGFMSGAIKE